MIEIRINTLTYMSRCKIESKGFIEKVCKTIQFIKYLFNIKQTFNTV